MNYSTTDIELKYVADAIREVAGESMSLSFPDGYVAQIQQIQKSTYSGSHVINKWIEGLISGEFVYNGSRAGFAGPTGLSLLTGITINNATTVAGFASCSKLTKCSFPDAKSIYGFMYCNNLETMHAPLCESIAYNALWGNRIRSIDLPNCTYLGGYNFSANSFLSSASIPECEYVGACTFAGTGLEAIDLPKCLSVMDSAFEDCKNLVSVSIPICTTIGSSAFDGCHLVAISLPACTSVGAGAFAYTSISSVYAPALKNVTGFRDMKNLVCISAPTCSTIGYGAFSGCTSLSSVGFSGCSYVRQYAFYSCIALKSVNLPSLAKIDSYGFGRCGIENTYGISTVSSIGSSAFGYCPSLSFVDLPSCNYVGGYAFVGCEMLGTAWLDSCSYIGYSAVANCYRLSSLFLLSTSVVSLAGNYIFVSTPIDGYIDYTSGEYGSIYVLASLITQYQSSTYWSLLSSRFAAVDEILQFSWNAQMGEYQPATLEPYEIMPMMEDGETIIIKLDDNGARFKLNYDASAAFSGTYYGTGLAVRNGELIEYVLDYLRGPQYEEHQGEMIRIRPVSQ